MSEKTNLVDSADEKLKTEKAEAEAKQKAEAEPKPKPAEKTRRTKEEKLADDIAEARALLSENGFTVESDEDAEPKKKGKTDFLAAVAKKGVLSATSGMVSATVDQNQVSVPVLRVSLIGWVGSAPLELEASAIDDVRAVLDELENQAH